MTVKSLAPFIKVNFQSFIYNDLTAFALIPLLYLFKLDMPPNSVFYEGLIWIVGLSQVLICAKSISRKSLFCEAIPQRGFIIFFYGLTVSVLVNILLFAVSYYVIYQTDNTSFSLSNDYRNYLSINSKNVSFIDFLYLSTMTIAGVGYGDITASINATKILSVCQMSFSFISFTYMFQNFSRKNKANIEVTGWEETGIIEANFWKNLLIPACSVIAIVILGHSARLAGVRNIYEIWTALYFVGQLLLLYACCYYIYWHFSIFFKERKELRFFFDKTALVNLSYSILICMAVWVAVKVIEVDAISIITIYLCVIVYSILFVATLNYRLKMQIRGKSLTQHIRIYFSFLNFTIVYAVFFWEIYVSNSNSSNLGFLAFSPGNYTFLDFFYFSITFFTVGFGDIVPLSPFVKSIIVLKILTSIFLVCAFINNYEQLTEKT